MNTLPGMAQKRHIMRLELTGPAKRDLETAAELRGMTQVALMSRLVEFFASRDEKLQTAIVGHFPEEMQGDIAKRVLQSLT